MYVFVLIMITKHAAWGATPSSPLRVYGIPSSLLEYFQRDSGAWGTWYIRGPRRLVI